MASGGRTATAGRDRHQKVGGILMGRRSEVGILLGLSFLTALGLGGCAKPSARLQAFLQEPRSPVSAAEYRIYPPDVVRITSLYVAEVNGIAEQVRPDGKINLPLVGEMYVAGRTPAEVGDAIAKAAREFYERTDATVQVVGYNSQKIYVFGQVGRPGPLPWTGMNTLLDTLAQTQPTQLAWPERIRLVRGKPPTRGGYLAESDLKGRVDLAKKADDKAAPAGAAAPTPAAAAEANVMTVNMMAMVQDGNLSQNVLLQPDDVIYVPPNPLAAVGLAIQQVLFPIRPAAEAVSLPASAATMATGGLP
jgi:protein involved in polysaccharide export with SLBB domain